MAGRERFQLKDLIFDLKMFNSYDTVFSLDNLFYERPDAKKRERDLEKEESNIWYIAPAPVIGKIPAAEELQRELKKNELQRKLEKNTASNHMVSEKEMLQLSVGEREKINFQHGSLKMVSLFLSPDQDKYKRGTGICQQPDANFSQSKILTNIPENGDDESAHSTLRKSLFKLSDCMYKNTKFKDSSVDMKQVDTYLNTSENMTEARKDVWRINHHTPITTDSDFTLHRVNDGNIASKIGFQIKSLPSASRILDKTDRNFVICAPTGSGKTVMFELAITRLLMEAPMPWLNIKIVYMAPIKALCSQRYHDWKEKFGPIGLNCKELTGDTVMDDLFEIHRAHIIITTPEKWDSMTRRWRDNSIVQLVHVIKDESRGATLEVVVSRMRTIQSSLWRLSENHDVVPPLRFVAVSATIPNAEDIAEWLSDGKMPAVCLKIDEDQRPVKLRKIVLGFPCSDNQTEFKFDLTLNYKIASVIQTYSEQKPALVRSANSLKDSKLRVTTSTLAMGVNLPAHLVVIKSTMHYVGGMFEEYSETDILQMIGRAGRPQFDTTATAVIMTRWSTREKYIQMLNGADIIESSLHRHLVEHLNAEIVLHTVTDVAVALEWIRSTFLYIRALKNPTHYETGRLMAWYYIAFETVKQFFTIKGTETLNELVTMISNCTEFLDVKLRINEKKILNTLNKDKDKITISLIQAQLGCIPIQDFTLTQDTGKIFRNGIRITRWLSDFLASSKTNFSALLNSVILAKCFRCKLWENSLHVSKQLEKIGVSLSNAMVNAGLTTFKKIEETNARELELILNRHPPFGNQIKESVLHLPKYELDIEQLPKYSDTLAEILVTIKLTNFEQLQTKRTAPDFHYVTLIIGDADNQVIFIQKIMDSVLLKTGNWMKKIEVRRALKSEDISINLISSDYVGLDIQQAFTAFYLMPRTVGGKVVTNKKLKAESPRKTGVPPKSEMNGDSKFTLYLADLRSRNSISSVPPMQMLNQAQNTDLKHFSFVSKSLMPALSRSGNKQLSSSTSVDLVDNVNSLGISQKQLQSWNYGKSSASDVNSELRDDIWNDLDDEILVYASDFSSRELDEHEIPCKYTTSKATSNISKGSCTLQGETNSQNPFFSVLNSSSKVELPVQSGYINMLSFQEEKHSNPSQELKNMQCSSISKTISDSFKFTRKEDFFFTKEQEEEIEPRYLLDGEISDVKPLLGLFDDIL
ncbi:putative ATP-dependent DNA helicase HFM1 isoform X1 [Aix galericulata]|nr:putative ATP-dependent DNA helicase HFM1 isoform X1 [Aix galericulata]